MNGKRSSPDSPRHYDAGSSSTSSSTFAPLDGAVAAARVVPDPASPSSLSPQSHSPSSIAGAQPPRKTRRTHARRSCLACRSRKARCELPDLNVPSSHDGLPTHLKCHRCRTLGTDCVVWDGDRKAKEGKAPRYGPPARAAVSQEQAKSTSEESGAHTATSREEDIGMDNRADVTPPKPPRRGPRSSASAAATAARRLVVTPAEVADTLSWDAEQAKRLHAQQHTASLATASSSSRLPPSSSSSSHPLKAAGPATSAPSTSSPSPPPPGGSTSSSSHAQPAGEDIRSFDYRKKLANAMDRNGAQVCEIIYKSPLYAARSTKYTSTASSHVPPTGPNPSLDPHRLAAFVYANPFLDDEVLLSRGATSKRSAPPLPAATLYLKQVTAYICERPHHELTLLGALIQRTLCHVMFQTRSRDVCQALLIMATYEPLDLILPRPSEDLDETVDHAPGNCLYLAAMNIALSLGLDGCIWKMCSGPKALKSSSPMEERLDRLREAALWLALSNFGVLCAWSSVNPNLPSPAPSLVDIEAFQTNIGPLARSEKYRHLAKPLTALALRSKFFHRIRTFWSELRALDISDISDIDPAMRLVGGMVEDVRAMDDWEVSAGEVAPNGFKGRAAPAPAPAQEEEEAVNTRMAPVLAWNRLERLDNVASLCTRLIFIFISVINAKTASASASAPSTGSSTSAANGAGATAKASTSSSSSSSRAAPSHADPQTSRLSMFEGWTASSHQTRAAAGILWAYIQESCEAILEDAGRFVPSHLPPHHQHDKQAAADGTRPPVVSFPLHIISPIGLSSCIFGAAKMLVGHSAAINFGYGQLHHNVDHQVGIMRRAIETLSRFDRGDSLSLPALMVRICEELVVRYEALIRAGKRREGARRASDAQEGDQPMSIDEAAAARASRSNSFSNSLHLRDGAGAAASVPSPHESTESTLRNWDVGMGRGRPSSGVGLSNEAGPAGRRPQYSPQSLRTPTGMATSSSSFSRLPSPATGTPTGSSWPGHHQLGLGLQQQPPTSLPSYGAVHQQLSPPASSSSTSSPFGPHGQPPTLPRPASMGSRGGMPAHNQSGPPYHSAHGPNGFAANQFSASSASPQPSAGPPSTSSSSNSAHLPPPPQPFLAPGNGVQQQQQHGYGSAAGSTYSPAGAQPQPQQLQQLNASSYSNTVLPPASTTAGADGLPFSEYDAALGNLFNQDLGDLISMDLTMLLGQGAGDGMSSTGEEGQRQTVESHEDVQPMGGSAQGQGDVMMPGYSQPTVTSGPASVAPPPPQQQQQGQRASQPPPPPPPQQQQQAQPPYYHPHYSTPPPPPPPSSTSGFAPQQHFQHHHHQLPPLGFQHAHGHGPSQGYGGPLPPPSSMASYQQQQQQHAQHHQGQRHGHHHHQPYAQHQQHQHQHTGQQQGHHHLPHLRPYH